MTELTKNRDRRTRHQPSRGTLFRADCRRPSHQKRAGAQTAQRHGDVAFSVLTHLAHVGETSPAKLARSFALTKGAITNTLKKLELSGYIHIRPDWDDARKKQVSISQAGRTARDAALTALVPEFKRISESLGAQNIKVTLPILRQFRTTLKS